MLGVPFLTPRSGAPRHLRCPRRPAPPSPHGSSRLIECALRARVIDHGCTDNELTQTKAPARNTGAFAHKSCSRLGLIAVTGYPPRLVFCQHLCPRLGPVVSGVDIGERLPVGVTHYIAAGHIVGAPLARGSDGTSSRARRRDGVCPPPHRRDLQGVPFLELIQPLAVRRHGHRSVYGAPRPSVTYNTMSSSCGALRLDSSHNREAAASPGLGSSTVSRRWRIFWRPHGLRLAPNSAVAPQN